MTLLITATCDAFVLSMADRRSSIQQGASFAPVDDRFNKHVMFALVDAENRRFAGAATFTGVAEWTTQSKNKVTTDAVIARALAEAAKANAGHGSALSLVAASLAEERRYLERIIRQPFPGFTVVIGGYLSAIREPFLALITDREEAPAWDEDQSQVEVPAPAPFRIHLAIRSRPTVFLGGLPAFVRPHERTLLETVVSAPGIRAYDAARCMLGVTRRASKRTPGIGTRTSAILIPANGWADTGLWQNSGESVRALMPRMVLPNGQQIDPSEMDLDIDNVVLASLPRHGLLFEGMLHEKIQRRIFRKLKRSRWPRTAPTTMGLLLFALYGKDPSDIAEEDLYTGPKWTFKA